MQLTGTIRIKGEVQNISEKFKKRDFVITDNSSQYPQHISLQLTQDRCALIDKYKVGDEIKCHINIRGREWSNPKGPVGNLSFFNTIECWKIEGINWSEEVDRKPTVSEQPQTDDLPF